MAVITWAPSVCIGCAHESGRQLMLCSNGSVESVEVMAAGKRPECRLCQQVVKNATKTWATEHAEIDGRVSFVGGDFFQAETLPKPIQGRNVYVMRSILHDWDDASSIKILRALLAVMKGTDAKLVLIEQVALLAFVGPT